MLSRRGVLGATSPSSLMAALRRLSTVTGHVAPPGSPSLDAAPTSHPSGPGAGSFEEGASSSPVYSHSPRGGERGRGYQTLAAGAASAALLGAAFSTSPHCDSAKPPPALNPKEFIPFKLKSVETLNHNTKVFRFELQPGQRLGLTVASCLVTKAPIGPPDESGNPKNVIRPYTPTTQPDVEGYFDLLVKVYPTGTMSKHIGSLKPGDTLEVKGPIPKLPYTPNMKQSIGMIAGGSGITPMLQVIDAIMANPEDNTQVSLVFANTSPSDVILKDRLEEYAARHPNFKVHFLVDKAGPSEVWKGGTGYVTPDLLKKAMPPPGDGSLILVCGPPGMMKFVSGDKAPDKSQGEVDGLLKQLGYTKDQVYKF